MDCYLYQWRVGSKFKELVKEKELSNLYIDLSEEILKNLVFDSSPQDNQNQLLFLNCIENSISYFADDIYKSFFYGQHNPTKQKGILYNYHHKTC